MLLWGQKYVKCIHVFYGWPLRKWSHDIDMAMNWEDASTTLTFIVKMYGGGQPSSKLAWIGHNHQLFTVNTLEEMRQIFILKGRYSTYTLQCVIKCHEHLGHSFLLIPLLKTHLKISLLIPDTHFYLIESGIFNWVFKSGK